MNSRFDIVKDSSIWYNKQSLRTTFGMDSTLHVGTVRSVFNDAESGELRYLVEVNYKGDTIPTQCRMMRRFGGAYNYEDTVMGGYSYNSPNIAAAKAGDIVLVGNLGGQGREGVILGGLSHPTRQNLKAAGGPEYRSEFNGIETHINKDGEYSLTFKGKPTNAKNLNNDRSSAVPPPEYDTEVGGGYLKWDKTGGFTICDKASSDQQLLFIDKNNGRIEFVSGAISLKFDKKEKSINYDCQKYALTSPDIKLGSASVTEQAILGTTFRNKQVAQNTKLTSALGQLATILTSAGASLSTAGANPAFAGAFQPSAAAIAAAGAQITLAVAQINSMMQAISSFESSAQSFLSNTVKLK